MFTHEDNRRTLIEWATGDFKVAKYIVATEDSTVGDHWHRNKDETFFLFAPPRPCRLVVGSEVLKYAVDLTPMSDLSLSKSYFDTSCQHHGIGIHVPRGTYHRFELAKGSVLLGVGTEAFDPKDEIAGRPPEARPEVRYFTRDDYIKRGFPGAAWKVEGDHILTAIGPYEAASWTASNYQSFKEMVCDDRGNHLRECDESGKIIEGGT